MLAANVPLAALLATAAVTAVVHTLAGPDHYLPLLAAARAQRWRPRTALAVTALMGLVHCGASALLVPFVLWLGRDFAGLQDARGGLSS
jgi:nickel/cobalt exporter